MILKKVFYEDSSFYGTFFTKGRTTVISYSANGDREETTVEGKQMVTVMQFLNSLPRENIISIIEDQYVVVYYEGP